MMENLNSPETDPADAPHTATGDLDSPAVSPRARTLTYVGALAVQVLAMLGFGLGAIFGAISAEQATQGIAVVTGAVGTLTAGLAAAYRPTRPGAPA